MYFQLVNLVHFSTSQSESVCDKIVDLISRNDFEIQYRAVVWSAQLVGYSDSRLYETNNPLTNKGLVILVGPVLVNDQLKQHAEANYFN
jgi:hypothetical protein